MVPRQEAEAEEPGPEPSKGGNGPREGKTGRKTLCRADKCLDVQEELQHLHSAGLCSLSVSAYFISYVYFT